MAESNKIDHLSVVPNKNKGFSLGTEIVSWINDLNVPDKFKVFSSAAGAAYTVAGFTSYFVPEDIKDKLYQSLGLSNWTSVAASAAPMAIGTAMTLIGDSVLDNLGLQKYKKTLNTTTALLAASISMGYQIMAETELGGGHLGFTDKTDLIVGLGTIVPAGILMSFWKKQVELHQDDIHDNATRFLFKLKESVGMINDEWFGEHIKNVVDVSNLDETELAAACNSNSLV